MKRYYVLITVILALIGAYTAYWFYALDLAKKGFADAVAAEQAHRRCPGTAHRCPGSARLRKLLLWRPRRRWCRHRSGGGQLPGR